MGNKSKKVYSPDIPYMMNYSIKFKLVWSSLVMSKIISKEKRKIGN